MVLVPGKVLEMVLPKPKMHWIGIKGMSSIRKTCYPKDVSGNLWARWPTGGAAADVFFLAGPSQAEMLNRSNFNLSGECQEHKTWGIDAEIVILFHWAGIFREN